MKRVNTRCHSTKNFRGIYENFLLLPSSYEIVSTIVYTFYFACHLENDVDNNTIFIE